MAPVFLCEEDSSNSVKVSEPIHQFNELCAVELLSGETMLKNEILDTKEVLSRTRVRVSVVIEIDVFGQDILSDDKLWMLEVGRWGNEFGCWRVNSPDSFLVLSAPSGEQLPGVPDQLHFCPDVVFKDVH